jgi:hypothetical protein
MMSNYHASKEFYIASTSCCIRYARSEVPVIRFVTLDK